MEFGGVTFFGHAFVGYGMGERGGGIGICGWLGGNYNTISEFTAEHDGAARVERYRGMLRGGV